MKQDLPTWTPRAAETSPRMAWGNSVRRKRMRMTIRSRVVRSVFFWRELPASFWWDREEEQEKEERKKKEIKRGKKKREWKGI